MSESSETQERAKGACERRTAPRHVLVPGTSPSDLEARQRALMQGMVKSAQESTTWDAWQYLVDLLCDAEGVRVLLSSRTTASIALLAHLSEHEDKAEVEAKASDACSTCVALVAGIPR